MALDAGEVKAWALVPRFASDHDLQYGCWLGAPEHHLLPGVGWGGGGELDWVWAWRLHRRLLEGRSRSLCSACSVESHVFCCIHPRQVTTLRHWSYISFFSLCHAPCFLCESSSNWLLMYPNAGLLNWTVWQAVLRLGGDAWHSLQLLFIWQYYRPRCKGRASYTDVATPPW